MGRRFRFSGCSVVTHWLANARMSNARNIFERSSAARKMPGRSAFTLVEMCLGLLVSAVIAGAVSAFMVSVSQCWTQTENAQTGALLVNQFATRFTKRFADAKRVGTWRNGSLNNAGFIYWQRDVNADG